MLRCGWCRAKVFPGFEDQIPNGMMAVCQDCKKLRDTNTRCDKMIVTIDLVGLSLVATEQLKKMIERTLFDALRFAVDLPYTITVEEEKP